MVGLIMVCAVILFGCAGGAKPAAAEAAFTSELLRCVDKATTLAESKACRRGVNAKWGIVETARDGGAE